MPVTRWSSQQPKKTALLLSAKTRKNISVNRLNLALRTTRVSTTAYRQKLTRYFRSSAFKEMVQQASLGARQKRLEQRMLSDPAFTRRFFDLFKELKAARKEFDGRLDTEKKLIATMSRISTVVREIEQIRRDLTEKK